MVDATDPIYIGHTRDCARDKKPGSASRGWRKRAVEMASALLWDRTPMASSCRRVSRYRAAGVDGHWHDVEDCRVQSAVGRARHGHHELSPRQVRARRTSAGLVPVLWTGY